MDLTVVTAHTGRELGTGPSRRLRNQGNLPGVVYGMEKDPVAVTVVYNDLRDALKTDRVTDAVLASAASGQWTDVASV